MNKKPNLILTGIIAIGLSACASRSPESDPTYVSSTYYNDYNCNQLQAEKKRISSKLEQMTELKNEDTTGQVLSTALAAFAISRGRGYNSNNNEDMAYKRLYNQYEVLEQTVIQKECF